MEWTAQGAAIWIGMALVASPLSVRPGMSVGLVKTCIGLAGGKLLSLHATEWIDFRPDPHRRALVRSE